MSAIAALVGRVQGMVTRGTVSAVDDGPQIQEVQVELLEGETQDRIEHLQPYGFGSRPKKGAEVVSIAPGGLKSHQIVIVIADRRYRVKLEEGEAVINDDQGQKVHLTRDGIVITGKKITMESEGDIAFSAGADMTLDVTGNFSVNAADFTVDASGDAVITASGHAELDGATVAIGADASLKAARDTDPINDSTHKIAGGSSKVKIA